MRRSPLYMALFGLCCLLIPTRSALAAATIKIVNGNAPGVGFNDPSPRTPIGGNPGTTLGEQRLNVFQQAANVWGATLDSPVEIDILATFEPLTCTATSAVLGSAGATSIFSDFPHLGFFPGPNFPNTWYHFALADKLAGGELFPNTPHIRARFNSSIGVVSGCLTGSDWYYGFDNNGGASKIDLMTVLLHEFGHGLGFSQFASVTSGAEINGMTDVFGRQILDDTTGKTWDAMTNAERTASAINPRQVVWIGNTVTTSLPGVLSKGVPTLLVSSPAGVAGAYAVGTAAFGPALSSPGVTANVVVGVDPADAAGPSSTDGCSAFVNAAQVAGRIALVDRGTCGFVVKVKNAQNAGAIGVLVADNVAGSPPSGLGGADPTITIPSVRISLSDGNRLKAALTSGAVSATLGVDLSRFAGADAQGRALLYTPNPVQPGSTISHWDTIATPNQLMEPAINGDLTHSVKPPQDLTLPLLRDIGWFPDEDNDGVADDVDQCHASNLTTGDVMIGSCDSTVTNELFSDGCTIKDLINKAATSANNHGDFVSSIAHLGDSLKGAGLISGAQKGALQSCVAQSK